jgi:signal transduction histidine kinase
MSGHLSAAAAGAALAVTAAAAATALGLSLPGGGVLVLLLSVLVATRWCGQIAGGAATLACAGLAVVMLRVAGGHRAPAGADVAALGLLGLLGAGIAAWTRRRSLPADDRAAASGRTDSSRLKEEFLATVSHELRTPLNAILGWTELLRMRRAAPPQQVDRGLEVIERNARRQLALVDELLTAAEPETSPDTWQPLDLRALLHDVLRQLEPGARAAQVGLVDDGAACHDRPSEAAGHVTVRGDGASLRMALRHIVDNAIKYTPPGGEVRTCLRQSGERVLIFVSDTGRGVATDEVEHIFEPFSQLDGSAARTHGGLGLGLTIARKLIERHGGHVDLRSDPAVGGATVLVTLPAAPRPQA